MRIYVRNIGNEPTAILKVRPTCGCTAVDFMKDSFAPGDSAWIDISYNPERRPGRFEKGIKVTPVDGEMTRIPIKGVVFASDETLDSMFPIEAGLLRLSESTLVTLRPLETEERTLFADVYNSGNRPVYISLESDSEAVEFQAFPALIDPGERGQIGIYLIPSKEARRGDLEYRLKVRTSYSREDAEAGQPFEIKILTSKE